MARKLVVSDQNGVVARHRGNPLPGPIVVRLYPAGTCGMRWRQRSYATTANGSWTWRARASLVLCLISKLLYWCSSAELDEKLRRG